MKKVILVENIGKRLRNKINQRFGKSLHIRHVDTGSSNACESELNSLLNPIYDIQRFGIDFVASPRHADMLIVTGGVTRNLERSLRMTYAATAPPKMIVAVGTCAIGGCIFGHTYANYGGVHHIAPVYVNVPGCPPRPVDILDGILLAVDRMIDREEKG